ncbi:MAG: hypothetical protein CML56_09315 [Rhodobacteraceae bacterium]|nr:hypothetical protein [Paracoccaceae bacterium]|tara:strand:+ start:239 stop:466 length:228 start_codon:yes stop_codon:yes gene_type:complete
MNQKWRYTLLILTTLASLSSVAVTLYVALLIEIKLSIGAVVIAIFWIVWFKQTGWYFLPEKFRSKILKYLPFYRQ